MFNVLLQVLDDGCITDSRGRTVDFKNTIIIMTPNIGSRFLLEGVTVSVKPDAKAKDWVAEKGYDSVFSARPLKRFLQRNVETRLARALIAGDIAEGSFITFTVENDELRPVQGALAAKK